VGRDEAPKWQRSALRARQNGREASDKAGKGHEEDYFKVAHVAAKTAASDTSAEDPAVVVKVAHAALADRAVMHVLVLLVKVAAWHPNACSTTMPPDAAAHAVHLAVSVDVVHASERLPCAHPVENRWWDRKAPVVTALDHTRIAKYEAKQAE